jgi:sugar phosphate isomerase/epimerase
MPDEPLGIAVCSWSLQVTSVAELRGFLDRLGINAVQIACGDPHHAAWEEGDGMPDATLAAGFDLVGSMLGFPGEDYTTPDSIRRTGGFGDPATRPERLERFAWGLERTRALGLADISLHAGFIPDVGDPDRRAMLQTLETVGEMAEERGVTVAFETGQETAELLRRTLDDLQCANLKVNFDPANMLLYDKGDPIAAVELLGPDIRSVHAKDAIRPARPGEWGTEVPLGQGEVDMRRFVRALVEVGYRGPLCIEREVGSQDERLADIAHGIDVLRDCTGAAGE